MQKTQEPGGSAACLESLYTFVTPQCRLKPWEEAGEHVFRSVQPGYHRVPEPEDEDLLILTSSSVDDKSSFVGRRDVVLTAKCWGRARLRHLYWRLVGGGAREALHGDRKERVDEA